MEFTENWIADWHMIDGDEHLSRLIIPVFEAYLTALQDKWKSKSTLRRHTKVKRGQIYLLSVEFRLKNKSDPEISPQKSTR